jgi:hypothetical protein
MESRGRLRSEVVMGVAGKPPLSIPSMNYTFAQDHGLSNAVSVSYIYMYSYMYFTNRTLDSREIRTWKAFMFSQQSNHIRVSV